MSTKKRTRSLADDYWVVDVLGSVFEASENVGGIEERIVFENLLAGRTSGKHIQHVLHPNAVVANTRTPTTLLGIKGDPIRILHVRQTTRHYLTFKAEDEGR